MGSVTPYLVKKFAKLIDLWINPRLKEDVLIYGRARILVLGIWFMVSVFLGVTFAIMVLDPRVVFSRMLIIFFTLFALSSLFILKYSDRINLAAWLLCACNLIVLCISSYTQGGVSSFVAPALLVTPLAAILFIGRLAGIIFALLSSVFCIFTAFSEFYGWLPEPLLSAEIQHSIFPVTFVFTSLIGMVILNISMDAASIARKSAIKERDRARTSEQNRAQFMATMSHELRTPMTGVISAINLLEKSQLTLEQSKLLAILRNSSECQALLLNDILDLSKIESGGVVIKKEPFDLGELVEQVIELYSHKASEKGLLIQKKQIAELSGHVIGDPGRVRQILNNLIGNAVKFTSRGSIRLIIDSYENEYIEFTVRDTGIGISQQQQQEIFKPYTQAEELVSREYGGTGLGLAITKSLVEAMQGVISLSSEPGVGTEIRFRIPFETTHITGQQDNVSFDFDTDWTANCANILLAEDNSVNRMLLERTLQLAGHTVETVKNGLEAIDLARDKAFDLIIMDLHMPKCDGLEAAKEIRANSKNQKTPILALTADAMPENENRYVNEAINEILYKPVNWGRLDKMLAEFVGVRKTSLQAKQAD